MRSRTKNVGHRGRSTPKSKRGRGQSSSNNDLRQQQDCLPVVRVEEPPPVNLTTSNCALCDSTLSTPPSAYDAIVDKYFESFCTFLNITMSEEFSWDFKKENFPFCTSCTVILKGLTNLYEVLEKTHYEIAGFVDQVKRIVINFNNVNKSKKRKDGNDNFSMKRIDFLRGQISLDIDESTPHVPPDQGPQKGNIEIKTEPPSTEISNNNQRNVTPSIITTTISSERGSVIGELDSDMMRATSSPLGSDNDDDEGTTEESFKKAEEETSQESLFDQYVREQLSLMKFMEEKEKDNQTLEDGAAAEDSDHVEDQLVEDPPQEPPEEYDDGDYDEAGSPLQDSKFPFDDDSTVGETTDNPPEPDVNPPQQESRRRVLEQRVNVQSVEPVEATVVGGRSLRPRNNNKRKYVEMDEVVELEENEKDEDFNVEGVSEDDESSHNGDNDDDEFEVENPAPRKRNKPNTNRKQPRRKPPTVTVRKVNEHRVKYSCGLCGRQFPNKDEAAQHYKEPHFTDNNFNCGLCGQDFTNREEMLTHQNDHQKGQQMKHFKERFYTYLEDDQGNFIREKTAVISKSDFVSKISCAMCTEEEDKERLKGMSCSEFSLHVKSHPVSDKAVQCLDCDTRSSTYSAAYIHYLTYHEENMPFHCLHCKEVFPVMSILSYHFDESHRAGVSGTRSGTVQDVDFLYDC